MAVMRENASCHDDAHWWAVRLSPPGSLNFCYAPLTQVRAGNAGDAEGKGRLASVLALVGLMFQSLTLTGAMG